MALPVYNSSIISAVSRVPQNIPFPQYVLGGQGGAGGTTYALFKKRTSTYVFSNWRSPVYNIGKNFDILSIKFAVKPALTTNMSIIPVLYFDNSFTNSIGTTINSTNYANSEKLITLRSPNFSNSVHGRNNFFLELQFTGSALAVVELPISFELEVEEI